MKKKLNLVLREPVKLHETDSEPPVIPLLFKKQPGEQTKTNGEVEENSSDNADESAEISRKMSLRVRQIWEYFCRTATAAENPRKSFTVTRSEVMREAGIGSTNTYRDALSKFKSLGLLEIEMRPGVNAGSIFHLTELGLEQTEAFLDRQKQAANQKK